MTSSSKKTSKKKNSSKCFETVISTIISFILSIFITLLCYMFSTYFGLFNKALLLDAMNKSSYYESVNSYTLEQAKDLAIPAGLDDSVFEDVFSLHNTYTEGKAYLVATLDGEVYNIDTSTIRDKLSSNINDYIKRNNISGDSISTDGVDAFIDKVCSLYTTNLSVPYITYYKGIKSIFSKIMIVGSLILILLSLISIFLLIKTHRWLHRALRYIAYSLISASLMTAILPGYILSTNKYKYLNISPYYLNRLISRYIGQSLYIYIYCSLIVLALALLIIALIFYRRQSLIK